jgi:DNA-binding transcriptional ArsR family regulator
MPEESNARELQQEVLRNLTAPSGEDEAFSGSKLLYDKTRLAILSALAVRDSMSFTELRNLLEVTDGNLSVHARKLEDAGLLSCDKRFEGRTPRTEYAMTDQGEAALERYLAHMERLINAVRRRPSKP